MVYNILGEQKRMFEKGYGARIWTKGKERFYSRIRIW